MSNAENLKKLFKEFGLEHKTKQLLSFARDSIRMYVNHCSDEDIPMGHSKIGGCPDVPTDFSWPYKNEDTPLYFLCQLNLNDIKPYDTNSLLPSDGILSFFYDAVEQPWGYDPKDCDGFKVFYFTHPIDRLSRMNTPTVLHAHGSIESASLLFNNELTLPPWESPYSHEIDEILNEREAENYSELRYESVNGEQAIHRIDGFPDAIQGDMYLECQLVTNGLYCGDLTGYNDPLRKELEAGATDWRLLLQLDSEEDLGFMWGDSGTLYFWIREEDCQNKRFDQAWVVLQCY